MAEVCRKTTGVQLDRDGNLYEKIRRKRAGRRVGLRGCLDVLELHRPGRDLLEPRSATAARVAETMIQIRYTLSAIPFCIQIGARPLSKLGFVTLSTYKCGQRKRECH